MVSYPMLENVYTQTFHIAQNTQKLSPYEYNNLTQSICLAKELRRGLA